MTTESHSNFKNHIGFNRLFARDKLTLGIFLPLDLYNGDLNVYKDHTKYIRQIDQNNFGALWVRDIPLFDPNFGDAGQVYDPFTYLSYLAGITNNIALGTGSIVLPFWNPISLAKTSSSLDHLSANRLIMGVGSGDRGVEFPAFRVPFDQRGERFRQVLEEFRHITHESFPNLQTDLTYLHGVDVIPKPMSGKIPVLITGASQQSLDWIARNGDGWITYPGATTNKSDTTRLEAKISAWRDLIPDGQFKPHMTNEWIELSDDPYFPRTPLRGGFVLKTGRNGLIDLLGEWQDAGVNHAALGLQFSTRPLEEVIDELAEEILPHFPSLIM
ncbi:luciferase-type oxidoreductase, BA3436 family [Sphingobacterium nematocida]|uniref:Luciferase-type oxidoreductase, BA3436 family n=1 Tax=Sphingobacterium nematocida TaxID=1513896 RepID=A0A1T5FL39_9SPHI|nr:LLM class oxidoreductase [Sphingobacterium nematocida]SKB96808.1 luciferase-type oxidoreductase, BA3436 family [Sphingobacterium nematocida]